MGESIMDRERRGRLRDALGLLGNAAAIVESVCDKEQDCMDNYPENLQGTERYEQMELAVDSMNDAMDRIEDAKGLIQAALG